MTERGIEEILLDAWVRFAICALELDGVDESKAADIADLLVNRLRSYLLRAVKK